MVLCRSYGTQLARVVTEGMMNARECSPEPRNEYRQVILLSHAKPINHSPLRKGFSMRELLDGNRLIGMNAAARFGSAIILSVWFLIGISGCGSSSSSSSGNTTNPMQSPCPGNSGTPEGVFLANTGTQFEADYPPVGFGPSTAHLSAFCNTNLFAVQLVTARGTVDLGAGTSTTPADINKLYGSQQPALPVHITVRVANGMGSSWNSVLIILYYI